MNTAEVQWPFSERNSLHIEGTLEALLAEPEMPLSEAEKSAALTFATELYEGKQGERQVGCGKSLGEVMAMSYLAAEQTYYPGYLQTEAGEDDRTKLGIATDADVSEKLSDVETILSSVKPAERKAIANRSAKWYRAELASALELPADNDVDYQDPEKLVVNFAPTKLLQKMQALRSYRDFYRDVRQDLKTGDESELTGAKHLLLDLHLARVNTSMAQAYPHVVSLAMQLDRMPAVQEPNNWEQELVALAPVVSEVFRHDAAERSARLTDVQDRLSRRLDYLRNGAALTQDGLLTPVAPETQAYAVGLSEQSATSEATFAPEVIEYMRTTRWQAEQFQDFLTTTLRNLDILSRQTSDYDEVAERDGPASDGRWQVVVSQKNTSLEVDSMKRVMFVPADMDRPLASQDAVSALSTAAHELTHVLQAVSNELEGQSIPLAQIKGRRVLTIKEMGGVYFERVFQSMAGYDRPTNVHYLRALEVKLAGGNRLQVARAFLDSSLEGKDISDDLIHTCRKNAVSSTGRLYRYGGHDSQPLDYLEQSIIVDAIANTDPATTEAFAANASSFSLTDYVALHRYGLWELNRNGISFNPAEVVRDVFWQHYLPGELKR